ncbi:MAG TPA: hypothetical protein VGM36_15810 [Rhizomicrobium sp.]|jgi:hypothetical protein
MLEATLDCSKVFVQALNRAAGLATREPQGYRFVAARRDLLSLEDQGLWDLDALEQAAAEIIRKNLA